MSAMAMETKKTFVIMMLFGSGQVSQHFHFCMLNSGTEIIKLYIYCKSLRAGLQHPAEILLEGIEKLCNVALTLLKYCKKHCTSELAVTPALKICSAW